MIGSSQYIKKGIQNSLHQNDAEAIQKAVACKRLSYLFSGYITTSIPIYPKQTKTLSASAAPRVSASALLQGP
jgi:hypothetical protein